MESESEEGSVEGGSVEDGVVSMNLDDFLAADNQAQSPPALSISTAGIDGTHQGRSSASPVSPPGSPSNGAGALQHVVVIPGSALLTRYSRDPMPLRVQQETMLSAEEHSGHQNGLANEITQRSHSKGSGAAAGSSGSNPVTPG